MIGAFAYLILTSARNRIRARISRLRNPRYALALVLGLAYVWMVYLRPASRQPRGDEVLGGGVITLLPLVTLAFVAWTWLFGADRNALAFTEAEVSLLFSAPLTRRSLVLYKIARTQLAILVTSIVWTLILRQAPTPVAALTHLVSYWVLLSTINLNRLGVALIRANSDAHGLRGARRNWIAIVVFAAILIAIISPIVTAWPSLRAADGLTEKSALLTTVLGAPPARWALLPFDIVVAPLHLSPGVEWLRAFALALALLAAMAVWVLRTDAAFEEAAAEASTRQALRLDARRQRRAATSAVVTHPGRSIRLAPTGPPAVALLWKNAMWIIRTGQLRGLLAPPAIGLACVAVFATRSPAAGTVIGVSCLALAVVMLLVGPMSMRNDLRTELMHLSLLKTLPLRGRDVVLAEVASGALPLAVMQYLLGLVALLAFRVADASTFTPALAVAAICAAPIVFAGISGAVFLIHNGLALLFPGWVRIGENAGGGIETLGLGMITLTFALVMLGALLLAPGLVFAIVLGLLRARLALAIVLGAMSGGALLLIEIALGARALGGALERVEPSAVEA